MSDASDSRAPVLVSWSGGKDSALALHALFSSPTHRPAGLLTTITEGYDRISMHGVRSTLLRQQAARTGLPLATVSIPPTAPGDVYAERMGAALRTARDGGIDTVAFGDLFLEDVRAYRERMISDAGMTALFPLWGADTGDLAKRFVEEGFRATVCCVDTTQLHASFAGRSFDRSLLDDLPAGVDPCGENGEFHTFLWDGPVLSSPVPISAGNRVLRDDRFMYCDLLPAEALPE
jgi:uncharacterized protein (TIGR00290 family)